MLSLITRYCTCVQISFAISEPKMFYLALNERQSAASLYSQFPKYQSSHLKKLLFNASFGEIKYHSLTTTPFQKIFPLWKF